MKIIPALAALMIVSACSGPWPQLPHNPHYDPDNWRVEEPAAPEPAPAPVTEPFVPDTQTVGTSSERARLPSNPKGAEQ